MRVAWGVLVVLAACGGGPGGADAGGAFVPPDQFGQQVAAVDCAKIFQCCDSREIAQRFVGVSPPVTTEAQCESYLARVYDGAAYPASLAAGRISYDGGSIADCVADIAKMTCSEYAGILRSVPEWLTCTTYIVPKVPPGGACAHDDECYTGNCDGGTCQPLPGLGQPCTHACAGYTFCGVDPGSATDVCLGLRGAGASCENNDECEDGVCVGASGSGGGTCGGEVLVCNGSGG